VCRIHVVSPVPEIWTSFLIAGREQLWYIYFFEKKGNKDEKTIVSTITDYGW